MENQLAILPLEFFDNTTNPKNPHLFEAVEKYCKQEFGGPLVLNANLKNWVVVTHDDAGYHVLGLTSLRYSLDCPTFHVTAAEDEEGRELARKVRDLLMTRAAAFLQDQFGVGTKVTVIVKPESERFWASYLRMIKAKPANRYEVVV